MAVQQRRNAQVVRFSPLPLKRFEGRCNRARAYIKRAGSFYAVRFAFLFCFAQFLNCCCVVHHDSFQRAQPVAHVVDLRGAVIRLVQFFRNISILLSNMAELVV